MWCECTIEPIGWICTTCGNPREEEDCDATESDIY